MNEKQLGLTKKLYSLSIKTHHSLDALSCGLSQVVHKCTMYIYYLGQIVCFCIKIKLSDCVSIRCKVSLQIMFINLRHIQKDQENSCKYFLFASDQLTFRHKFDCCDARLNVIVL